MNAKNFFRRTLCAAAAVSCAILTGCATQVPAMNDTEVRSVLVVPPINESNQVGSELLLLSGTSVPVGELGYYVFPVDTVKMVLEGEGLYEPERIQQMAPNKICGLFGADSVLYIRILEWDAKYVLLDTQPTVHAQYTLWKADGTKLFEDDIAVSLRSTGTANSLGGLIAKAVVAAMVRAAPNFKPAAAQVHQRAFQHWAPGPYSTDRAN